MEAALRHGRAPWMTNMGRPGPLHGFCHVYKIRFMHSHHLSSLASLAEANTVQSAAESAFIHVLKSTPGSLNGLLPDGLHSRSEYTRIRH